MNNKDITAVITSFKSETKILNCIKSLGKDFKIIIIENSNDKKLTKLLPIKPDPPVTIIFFIYE